MKVAAASVYVAESDTFMTRLIADDYADVFQTPSAVRDAGQIAPQLAQLREHIGLDTPIEFRAFDTAQVLEGKMRAWLDGP